MKNKISKLFVLVIIFSLLIPTQVFAQTPITFTILHTNDFHGQLESSGSNPGYARTANTINGVIGAVGAANVLVVDAGDEMQGSLLSNLNHGEPVIDAFNTVGVDIATFGNHEFDWGQDVITARTTQAAYPYVTANITKKVGDTCTWDKPDFADAPYQILTVGTAPNTVDIAFIGVTTMETPTITIASATAGLCFRDPTESILHYYDEMKAAADVVVVISHLGYPDGGYGYGIPVYGDQTLAKNLINAGKPVDMIIGGHSHTDLSAATVVTVVDKPGSTVVAQAHYNGRKVGRADFTYDPATGAVSIVWTRLTVNTTDPEDATVKNLINGYANDPDYLAIVNQPIGYVQTDLLRNYNGDSMMANFIDDAIYNYLNNDAEPSNDVDIFFNNSGGIRSDWCDKPDPVNPGSYIWSSTATDCSSGVWTHDPMLLNYGQMFTILPFGNATVVGEMTGAQIQDVLNQAATLGKGAIPTSGLRYKFYSYSDANPGPQPYAWGSYDACVINPTTTACEPLEANRVYKVGTNEFLAPAGGDNFSGFKYMKNITYWGDMLNAVNDWVANNYTITAPYKGPKGDGELDGRITQEADIVPVTILHHNDSHGRLLKSGSNPGLSQLATIVNQERAHNPNRTLLFSLGDNIQGDSMMYYFKNAAEGTTADGTVLPPNLQTNPFIKAMNAMGYNGMVLGNHEFNFGSAVFDSTFSQASFPLLGANVSDDGSYGINKVSLSDLASANVEGVKVNVYDGYEYMLPSGDPDDPDITVGVLGLTNHRVPNYELPSNIPGLTFSDPLQTATELVPMLDTNSDAVVALTHIGFTEDPKSVEVDANVDTNLAKTVSGIDMIIGGHSHTNPSTGFGDYKYLPALVGNPDNQSVIINQAYRYNQYLGEMVLGFKYDEVGGYKLVATAGRYISISSSTVEDPTIKAIVDPYQAILNNYNNTTIGETLTPIDALDAFTQETNGANLQADASMWELQSHGITVDFHLSGAMTNKKIADTATPTTPYTLKISDMFTAMPYENSLVVLKMTGPELKAVLERGYRNYYYYKYVPGYGGYSYYTTCMLDTSDNAKIYYKDTNPQLPNGNNVFGLQVNGKFIDFTDPTTTYNVSTVNYLAAGSCNFNNGGVTLWPLDSIVADTQYYVRDAVINYVMDQETINPQIEGRLVFNGFLNLFLPFIIK